jgi:hypothetical protein
MQTSRLVPTTHSLPDSPGASGIIDPFCPFRPTFGLVRILVIDIKIFKQLLAMTCLWVDNGFFKDFLEHQQGSATRYDLYVGLLVLVFVPYILPLGHSGELRSRGVRTTNTMLPTKLWHNLGFV